MGNREWKREINRKEKSKMKKLIIAMGIAALVSGCYIGKAAFQGEDMKI